MEKDDKQKEQQSTYQEGVKYSGIGYQTPFRTTTGSYAFPVRIVNPKKP